MFTCEMLQVCNHSVLICPLGMGFGHRNCVVVGCPNSGKRLNKWAKQTCTVHACLKWTHTCDCEPPFKLFTFPPHKRDQEQFSKSEVKKTKVIANLRNYVERAIRRLQTFRLIKNELPISMLGRQPRQYYYCLCCNL